MSLSSVIVQREVATMRQVEEALARQVLYGGDLATNLLEVAPVNEVALMRLIAETMGLAPAPPGELPVAPQPVPVVSLEMAVEQDIVPLACEAGRFVVAVVRPLPRDIEERLASECGLAIEQRAASAVRVRQALTRLYGLPLDRRMQQLVVRLSAAPASAAPQQPTHDSVPLNPLYAEVPSAHAGRVRTPPLGSPIARVRPTSLEVPARRRTSRSFPAATLPMGSVSVTDVDSIGPRTPVVMERPAGLLERKVPSGTRSRRRRRGPLSLEATQREAEASLGRDALLHLFFDFSRQFFEYAALLLVHGDIAEGFDAFGMGAARERIVGIGVPLDIPSLLSKVRDERMPLVTKPPGDGLDAVLLTDLQRPRDVEVAVVPIVVRTRVVAILIGDCADEAVDRACLEQVVTAASIIGQSLERVIVRRKLEGFVAVGAPSHGVTGSAAPSGFLASMTSAARVSSPVDGAPSDADMPRPALAPVRPHSSLPPPPANIAAVRPISGLPIPREEPESVPGGAGPGPPSVAAPSPKSDPAVVAEETIPKELDARALFDLLGWETGSEVPEAAPASASFALPPHRPPLARTSSIPALPSVIVDLDQELETMVDRVVSGDGDESAEAELLRQGDRAMRVIKSRFPGPVTFERARIASNPAPPRASDCGPLLRLVARERKVALPFVLDWMSDPDPETRGWATHLVCELPYAEAIPHVLIRLRDPDTGTRASALLAVAAIAKVAPDQVRDAIQPLSSSAEAADRVAAVRAMAALRQSAGVPSLLGALGDGDERVVVAAGDALVQVTGQDFGTDAQPWMEWWDENASRHRIEWLIDALTHDTAEIRRAAGEELRTLSREYFGYAADLPARERDRAQQRYRDWWTTEGRYRFRGR